MEDKIALYREQWDNWNMTKDLFGVGFDVLFSELYKIMVNKVTFVGLGDDCLIAPWILPCTE